MCNKLLIFSEYFLTSKGGGTQKSLKNILDSFSITSNYKIITGHKDLDNSLIINDNIKYISNVIRTKNLKDYLKIFKLIYQSDKLYFNSFFSFFNTIIFLPLPILLKKKIIIAPRGELFIKNLNFKKKFYIFFFSFIKNFFLYHCTSDLEKNQIQKILKIKNKAKFVIIRNLIGPSAKLDYVNNNLKENKFLYLSRIDKKKNLLGLCESMNKIKNSFKIPIFIDVYGYILDKEYFKECKKYFELLKNKNIYFSYCGHIQPENIEKILSKYVLLIHPSHNENFGHVIIEALSIGLSVLASKDVFLSNLEENKCGYNIDFKDHKFIYKILLHYSTLNSYDKEKNSDNSIKYYKKILLSEEKIISDYDLLLSTTH